MCLGNNTNNLFVSVMLVSNSRVCDFVQCTAHCDHWNRQLYTTHGIHQTYYLNIYLVELRALRCWMDAFFSPFIH